MQAYVKFDNMYPVFLGGVTVGAYAGWSQLHVIDLGSWAKASGLDVNDKPGASSLKEILVTKSTDRASPALQQICAVGRHLPGRNNAVLGRIDFTEADGRGGEVTKLSLALHGVALELDKTAPQGSGTERYRLRYVKMTYANMPASSPDMSLAVRESLRTQRTGTYHSGGGIVVVMGDGSVR